MEKFRTKIYPGMLIRVYMDDGTIKWGNAQDTDIVIQTRNKKKLDVEVVYIIECEEPEPHPLYENWDLHLADRILEEYRVVFIK